MNFFLSGDDEGAVALDGVEEGEEFGGGGVAHSLVVFIAKKRELTDKKFCGLVR